MRLVRWLPMGLLGGVLLVGVGSQQFAPSWLLVALLGCCAGVLWVLRRPTGTPRPAQESPQAIPAAADLTLPYRDGTYVLGGTFSLSLSLALARLGSSTFVRMEDKLLKIVQAMVMQGGTELHINLDQQRLLFCLHSPHRPFSPADFDAGFDGYVTERADSAQHYLAVGICSLGQGPVRSIRLSSGSEAVTLLGTEEAAATPAPELRLQVAWNCPEWKELIPYVVARCVFAPLPLFVNGDLVNGRVGWPRQDALPFQHLVEAFFGGVMPASEGICLRPSGACRATLGPAPAWPRDARRGYPRTTDYRVVFAAESGDRPLVFRGSNHFERFDSRVGHAIVCVDARGGPGVVVAVKAGVTLESVILGGCAGLYAILSAEGLHTDLSGFRLIRDQALLAQLAADLRAKAVQALQALIDAPQVLPVRQFHFRSQRAGVWLALCLGLEALAVGGFSPLLLLAAALLALLAEAMSAALEARLRANQYRQQAIDALRLRIRQIQG